MPPSRPSFVPHSVLAASTSSDELNGCDETLQSTADARRIPLCGSNTRRDRWLLNKELLKTKMEEIRFREETKKLVFFADFTRDDRGVRGPTHDVGVQEIYPRL